MEEDAAEEVVVVIKGDIVEVVVAGTIVMTIASPEEEEITGDMITSMIVAVAVVRGMIGMTVAAATMDILQTEVPRQCHLLEWLLLRLHPRF